MSRRTLIPAVLLLLAWPCSKLPAQEGGSGRTPSGARTEALRAEFKKKREALAKDDAAGHFELAKWCEDSGLKGEAELVLKQIVKIDPNHEEARKLLGFVRVEGKWVAQKDLDKRKDKQQDEENLRKGLVKHKGEWVPKEDVPFLEKGMVRVEGTWLSKADAEKIAKDWKRVDGEWVSPEEAPNADKGLYKVDGKWVTKAEANTLRADWEKAWQIHREHVVLRTNVDRDRADALAAECEIAYGRLKALLGKDSKGLPLLVFGFRSLNEFNRYGEQFGEEHSSCYGAYLALRDEDRPAVCNVEDKNWASYFLAHALGHVYVDRLTGGGDESAVPAWLEEGIASYVEGFFNKANRDWSVGRLVKRGGLGDPKRFTKSFGLSPDDIQGSEKMILENGLLVAYFVDGADEKEKKLFADVVKAVTGGVPKEIEKAAEGLLRDSTGLEKKIRAFAGMK